MSDAFISYSRQDKAFVEQLQQALIARKRQVWVDLKDIPPTADWLNEIYAGIEGADAFLCVLSPDYAASQTCSLELAHAIACKKRLIPILYRDVRGAQIAPALAGINWVNCRQSDDFEHALGQLTEALDTDLEYVREGTKVLVRALEWERRGYNASFTLRGNELTEAEHWLAQGAEKALRPTALQVRYISAGRRAERSRQRRLLTGVSAALVVTLLLSTATSILFVTARAAQQQAQANYTLALSRQLAAQALNHLDDQPDLALLLSAEAYRRADTTEARNSLLRALQARPQLDGYLYDPVSGSAGWLDEAFSPDGKYFAALDATGKIAVWKTATRQRVGPLLATRYALSDSTAPTAIAFSPDSKVIASASFTASQNSSESEITLLDVTTGRQVASPLDLNSTARNLAFSPDGAFLAIGGCAPYVSGVGLGPEHVWLWSLRTQEVADLPLPSGADCNSTSVAFSPDGRSLAAATRLGTMLWNTAEPALPGRLLPGLPEPLFGGLSETITSVTFSGDGRLLAAGQCGHGVSHSESLSLCASGAVQIWDTTTGRPHRQPLQGHNGSITDVAFSPQGNLLATAGEDDTLRLWDVATGKEIVQLRTDTAKSVFPAQRVVKFSPDGSLVASFNDQGSPISLWKVNASSVFTRSLMGFASDADSIGALLYSPDGRTLTAAGCVKMPGGTDAGTVWLWSEAAHRQIREAHLAGTKCLDGAAYTADGKRLAVTEGVTPGLTIWLLDTTTLHASGSFMLPDQFGPLGGFALSPDGAFVAAGDCGDDTTDNQGRSTGHLWLEQVATHKITELMGDAHRGCVNDVTFSPDSGTLAASVCHQFGGNTFSCGGGEIQLWNVTNGQFRSIPFPGDVTEATFSPDGKRIAAITRASGSTSEHGAFIWDIASGQRIGSIAPDAVGVQDIMFDRSWQTAVAIIYTCKSIELAGFDCRNAAPALQLWDVGKDQAIGDPIPLMLDPSGEPPSLHYNPNGDELVTAVSSPQAGVTFSAWDTSGAAWKDSACQLANRNLRSGEWASYLPGEPYHSTCPGLQS